MSMIENVQHMARAAGIDCSPFPRFVPSHRRCIRIVRVRDQTVFAFATELYTFWHGWKRPGWREYIQIEVDSRGKGPTSRMWEVAHFRFLHVVPVTRTTMPNAGLNVPEGRLFGFRRDCRSSLRSYSFERRCRGTRSAIRHSDAVR